MSKHLPPSYEESENGSVKYNKSSDAANTEQYKIEAELPEKQNGHKPEIEGESNGSSTPPPGTPEPPPKPEPTPVGIFQLFRFSTALDKFLIIFGIILAFSVGGTFPLMTIIFGDALQAFVDFETYGNCSDGEYIEEWSPIPVLGKFAWQMATLGGVIWVSATVFFTCFNTAAARQVFRIRGRFLQSVLRQDIAWYDTNTTTDFASRMTEDLNKLQEGIGEKIGMLCYFTGTFVISMIVAFYYGWELTLVLLSMIPLMIVSGGILAKAQTTLAEKEMSAYATAGAIAEEVLAGVRTVVAFGGQEKEIERYTENLTGAKRSGIFRGMLTGASGGITFGIMYAVYGLGFWYGVKLIMDDRESASCLDCFASCGNSTSAAAGDTCIYECINSCVRYNAKSLITVFFSVLFGGFQLGQAAPYAEALATAQSAAGAIFRVIDRVPDIDSSSEEGVADIPMKGDISFQGVSFSYPSRPDVPVLTDLSIDIPRGKTVALVGSSGCGKSTCIQLVQRFYDPLSGGVTIDNQDIRDLNIGWLRSSIGIVSQEPVLFDCTIRENILIGNPAATETQILAACQQANAMNFIRKLPLQLDTMVGERGAQLSGGQKQRIAIARALVKNPQILLLDEATSALDNESESVVQAALDRARAGRTTIVVAHRLTTIQSADIIVAMEKGRVKERGTHSELMAMNGLYHSLVTRQLTGKEKDYKPKTDGGQSVDEVILSDLEAATDAQRNGTGELVNGQSNGLSASTSKQSWEATSVSPDGPEDEIGNKVPFSRLVNVNRPEFCYILVGVLASCAMGGSMPVFSILFADVTGILSYADANKARDESVFYALMFGLLGLGCALAMFLQGFMFGISGENLTLRLRSRAFAAMLRQEIGWFDHKDNNTGALCARLSGDAAKVQGATGARVGSIVQGIAGMVIAVVLGIVYSWKLGLLCSVFFPLLIFAVFLEMKISMGVDTVEKKAFETSSKLAIEAISNIRTVAGLRCEKRFYDAYLDLLETPHKLAVRRSYRRGVLFGFSQAAQFFGWGLTTYYGGVLVAEDCLPYSSVMLVTNAIIGGAGMVGYSFAFTADFNKALIAAGRVFHLLDRKPRIDDNTSTGLKLDGIRGNMEFRGAEFSYPSRPEVKVLKCLSLAVKSGQKVALVGESGCGKSTIIQLIQRFYDVSGGSLTYEGQDIKSLNVPYVRSHLGIVSQEPTLFDRTIAENIQYGDNTRTVPMEEVIDAARRANIHNFVAALPGGYSTRVGSKGTHLSGGQKQRVAIARALVKNPTVLLLDEATSALDTESEKVVQDALNSAQQGRTSVTIAHRLSTVMDADIIFVMEAGELAEMGSHKELLEKEDGHYYNLWHSAK